MPSAIFKKPPSIDAMIIDRDVPLEIRKRALLNLLVEDSEASQKAVASLLEKAAQGDGENLYKRKVQELSELKKAMETGPLRVGTFIRIIDPASTNGHGHYSASNGDGLNGKRQFGTVQRAHVRLEDGSSAYTVMPDPKLAERLEVGDTVLIEAQGRTLVGVDSLGPESGEEAQLERRIDEHRVEVTLRDHERIVCLAAANLIRKLDSGEVEPGCWLLACPRRNVAFDAVPRRDRLSHYRFLVKEPAPDVIIERDIGDPPAFLAELGQHIRMEMTQPDRLRRYRLPRSRSVLMHGVSGSGKTLCIQALWRMTYEVMSEVTGIAVAELPPRVLRLRSADVLSKWYSESEKLVDKFFDEAEEIASVRITGLDGKQYAAPTLVICEEADALGRARGNDGVHDRVQNTLLERMDVLSREKLRENLVLFVCSTNLPQAIDGAFLRRAAGISVEFGRLSRQGFCAVLDKHLRDIPIHQNGYSTQDAARRRLKNEVISWLFSTRGEDKGIVEITFAGATQPDVRYRRDMITGAIVQRAVQQAASEACYGESSHGGDDGITAAQLITAFDRQVRAICDQLNAGNVSQYVTLPDGVRVANVRRIPQPPLLSVETIR